MIRQKARVPFRERAQGLWTVASLSGISSWKFVIDFDYKGHLTSDYTVASSNDGSGIAERVADRPPRG